MAINEKLAQAVRAALADTAGVEEKKMFGGLAFMVHGKMCITVNKDRIMCRIDKALHENAIMQKGVSTTKMGDREYKGFIFVQEEAISTKKDLDYWVELALDFNKTAKAGRKK